MKRSVWPEPSRLLANDYIPQDFGLCIQHKIVETPQCPPLHWHNFCEIELILDGSATHLLNGVSMEIQRGTLYFLTPADFHSAYIHRSMDIFNLQFSDSLIPSEFLGTLMRGTETVTMQLDEEKLEYMRQLMSKLLEEFDGNGEFRESYMRALLTCIFAEIANSRSFVAESGSEQISEPIRKVLMYLHCNFRENPSLSTSAAVAGLNDNYFCEMFHKATGQRYNRYLNDLKLKYAYNLIMNSDISVTDICFASGFSSMPHFQREFKARFGCSSQEARRGRAAQKN